MNQPKRIIFYNEGIEAIRIFGTIHIWKGEKLIAEFPVKNEKFRIAPTAPWLPISDMYDIIDRYLQLRGIRDINMCYEIDGLTLKLMHNVTMLFNNEYIIWLHAKKDITSEEIFIEHQIKLNKWRKEFDMSNLWTFKVLKDPETVYKKIMQIFAYQF